MLAAPHQTRPPHVRDETRKAQVIANVRADADSRGLPAVELAAIWEQLVEASIAYELVEWDRLSKTARTA